MNRFQLDELFSRARSQKMYAPADEATIETPEDPKAGIIDPDTPDPNKPDPDPDTPDPNKPDPLASALLAIEALSKQVTELTNNAAGVVKKKEKAKPLTIAEQIEEGIIRGLAKHKTNGILESIKTLKPEFTGTGFSEEALVEYLTLLQASTKPVTNSRKPNSNISGNGEENSNWTSTTEQDRMMVKIKADRLKQKGGK